MKVWKAYEQKLEKIYGNLIFCLTIDRVNYKIIEMKYFEKKTNNLIAEALGVDEKTVRRNKNRLIETISIWIFPDEVLNII